MWNTGQAELWQAELSVEHWAGTAVCGALAGRGALGRQSCVWSTGQAELSVEHWAGTAEYGALGMQS